MIRSIPPTRGVWAPAEHGNDWSKLLPPGGFRVLPRRWVVERTFAWLGAYRRLSSKDYERLPTTSENYNVSGDHALDAEAAHPCLRLFRQLLVLSSSKAV